MRKIGETPDKLSAQRFCDFLLTKEIASQAEQGGSTDESWILWIREEDHIAAAKEHLTHFLANPDDAKYSVEDQVREIRKTREAENRRRLEHQKKVERANQRSSSSSPFGKPRATLGIIITCVVLFFVTDNSQPVKSWLTFRHLTDSSQIDDPLASVKQGQVWRVFTPNLLHGDIRHLLFNMVGMFFLGRFIEFIHGPRFFLLFVLLLGCTSIMAQAILPASLGGGPNVVGISGVVLGFFGYLWIRPILDPMFPTAIPLPFIILMLVLLGFGFMNRGNSQDNVAHIAHLAGLITGIIFATLAANHANR